MYILNMKNSKFIIDKFAKLIEQGLVSSKDLTAELFNISHTADDINKNFIENSKVVVAGRLMSRRIQGKASFAELMDSSGKIQVYFNRDEICPDDDKTKYNDLYKKLIDKMPTLMIPNIIFRNQGNLNFKKESKSVGMEKSYSNGAAYSDLDNDGDVDLVINNINQEVFILENLTDGKNHSVQIILSNNDNNYSSIGAKVNLYLNNKKLTKQLNPVKGFQSSSSYKINFGIESNSKVDSLSVISVSYTHLTLPTKRIV